MATAFAWPLCICVAVVVIVLILKPDISGFIARLRSVTREGAFAEASALAAQEARHPVQPTGADELLQGFDNQLLLEQETALNTFLQQKNLNAADRDKVLTRYLAGAYLVIRFEMTYRSVFGSQLQALGALNQSEPDGTPRESLRGWYAIGKITFPSMYNTYTFEEWFNFLLHNVLVVGQPNGNVRITVFAKEFLKYLVDTGYSTAKTG